MSSNLAVENDTVIVPLTDGQHDLVVTLGAKSV